MRIKHKFDEENAIHQKPKRAKTEDKSVEARNSSRLMSLDEEIPADQVAPMFVDSSPAEEKKPITLPTLHSIVKDASLNDKQKIAILSERIKLKTASIHERDVEGRSILAAACVNSGVELAEWLLKQDKDILYARTNKNSNVLFFAAEYANRPLFYYFLAREPKFATEINFSKSIPLDYAAKGGDKEIFLCLLNRQEKPLTREFLEGRDLLRNAVFYDRLEFIQWMVRDHIELMVSCQNIGSAIHHAKHLRAIIQSNQSEPFNNDLQIKDSIISFLQSFLSSREWCDFLIKHNLHNKPNKNNYYPMHTFAHHGCLHSIELLLEAKASVDLQSTDESKTTPLFSAVENNESEQLDAVKLLAMNGANINRPNGYGFYPIHLAVIHGNIKIVEWLLTQGIPVNLVEEGSYRKTAMHHAAIKGALHLAELLYQHKAEINKPDGRGFHPIHHASINNRVNIVTWLLKNGVSPDQPTDSKSGLTSETPLLLALERGYFDVVEVLQTFNAKYTCLEKKSSKKGKQAKKSLDDKQFIDFSVDLPHGNIEQRLFFAAAKYSKALPILKNLLTSGVSINTFMDIVTRVDDINPYMRKITNKLTALHEAIRHNNKEGVDFLLKNNANLFFKINDEIYCGVYATTIISRNAEIFQLLFSKITHSKDQNIRTQFIEDVGGKWWRPTAAGFPSHPFFEKPFPKDIFALMKQKFTPSEIRSFANIYLDKLVKHISRLNSWNAFFNLPQQDAVICDTIINLIKYDAANYITIINEQCNNKSVFPFPCEYRNIIFRHLAKPIFEEDRFLPFLIQNNYDLLVKIVSISKDKQNIKKLLTLTSVNKDFKIMHFLLCRARSKGSAAILESVTEAQRKELLRFNDFEAINKVMKEGGIKTFFYLIKQLNDPELQNQLFRHHLKSGITFIITERSRFAAGKIKYLEYFLNGITLDAERNQIISEMLPLAALRKGFYYLFNRIKGSDNRRNLLLSFAPKIKLVLRANDSGQIFEVTPFTPWLFTLSFLNEERDRQLFLLLLPSPTDPDQKRLFEELMKNKSQLLQQAAAMNHIFQIHGYRTDFFLSPGRPIILEAINSLRNLIYSSKMRIFPKLCIDLYLHIVTYLTGLPPKLTKHIMDTMHIDGINIAKSKGLIINKKMPEKQDVKSQGQSSITNNPLTTFFVQRMSVVITETSSNPDQNSTAGDADSSKSTTNGV